MFHRTAAQKGRQGEREVSRRLHRLSKRRYLVLDDLMLLSGRNFTQIDHVVVSVYGIFVIETKNYHGEIYGKDRSEYWTQVVHGKKYPFRNPFRQNYAHIQALKELLDITDADAFFSIAAVSNQAVLCVETEQALVHFSKLKRKIRSYREIRFDWEEVQYLAGSILCANLDSKEARKSHLEQIDNEIAYRNFAAKNGLCPRCGGKLLLRRGQDGSFYGCSNYPVCHYTQDAPDNLMHQKRFFSHE